MAEVGKEPNLKYLGVVHTFVLQATAYFFDLYTFAKDSSGPLRPGVDNVEGTVKTVVGPVYHKVEGKPLALLQFVDSTVDETLSLLDEHVPQFLKEIFYKVYDVAKQEIGAVRAIFAEVQKQGPIATASNYYQMYEPAAEQIIFQAWQWILAVPYVPQLVDLVAPCAKFGAEQYNRRANGLKEKHVSLSCLIPLVPIERIVEATRTAQAG